MPLNLLVTASLKARSGQAEDDIVNTFAFEVDDAYPGDNLDAGMDATEIVRGFYQSLIGVTGRRLETWLAGCFNAYDFFAYDITEHMDGSNYGSPIVARENIARAVANNSDNTLPTEVATVLQFRALGHAEAAVEAPDGADAGAAVDRPRQRRTGRVYIGPLMLSTRDSNNVTFDPVVKEQFRGDLLVAASNNLGGGVPEIVLPAGLRSHFSHGVWSRSDMVMRPVIAYFADNAFDTIRGRGRRATITSGIDAAGNLI